MDFIYKLSSQLWGVFLPFLIFMGFFIIYGTFKIARSYSTDGRDTWCIGKVKSSLSISLSSKVGTGAIIGVLAAMNRLSQSGMGGEGIVLWVLVGMVVLVPLTYSEVFLSRVTKKPPRDFIDEAFNRKVGTLYIVSLVILYSFGFVGFQLMGIQSVLKIFIRSVFQHSLTPGGVLAYIILPIIFGVFAIIITKSHEFFIGILGSMISSIITLYILFFVVFLARTYTFIPEYLDLILKDFLNFKSAAMGVPIGLIIGFQRIIQISETALGTSALCSSDGENSPKREAVLQTISTVMTLFIAVVITSYVFTYGRHMLSGVELSPNGFERLVGYLTTVKAVTGMPGLMVVIAFFIFSGFTTVLGSFHFANVSLHFNENGRIAFYMFLISVSGLLSVSNFDVIFDITDLLMFIVGGIMVMAMKVFVWKRLFQSKEGQLKHSAKL